MWPGVVECACACLSEGSLARSSLLSTVSGTVGGMRTRCPHRQIVPGWVGAQTKITRAITRPNFDLCTERGLVTRKAVRFEAVRMCMRLRHTVTKKGSCVCDAWLVWCGACGRACRASSERRGAEPDRRIRPDRTRNVSECVQLCILCLSTSVGAIQKAQDHCPAPHYTRVLIQNTCVHNLDAQRS